MRYQFFYLLMLCANMGYSQIPNGYYNNATESGYLLKTQLYNIINNHNDQGYNAIDNFFVDHDLDNYYENNTTILDIYSENPTGSDPYNFTPNSDACGAPGYNGEGDCYNKEHIIPQSVFNSNNPMRGDAHQLFPTDGRVNGFRGSYPMGRVNNNSLVSQSGISNPTQNGSKLGNNLNSGYSAGYSEVVFEPIDEFKGDIARAHFYFATRYENLINNWSNYAMFDGTSDKVFETSFLSILLEWHAMDPVSQKEIDRNNAIYYQHQGNRNPFVDHPEFVTAIWAVQQDSQSPTTPTNVTTSNATASTIDVSWTAATDNVAVTTYDVYKDGTLNTSVNSTSLTITGLSPETNYCFTIVAKDAANNSSPASTQACEMTLSGNTTTVDLFFSEYMEGSSFNKALEIANFTGSSINLSNYTVKLSTNGSTSWGTTYNFPSNTSLANETVYVIANGSLNVCNDVVDNSNSSITGFNGNDAIGLFKNDNLIDIIGTLGNSQDFAENTTLVRQANVSSGSTVYDASQWTSFSSNTCDNLGSHTQTLGQHQSSLHNITIHPNPASGSFINIEVQQTTSVLVLNLLGQTLIESELNQTQQVLPIHNLNSGVYYLYLKNSTGMVMYRFIKN